MIEVSEVLGRVNVAGADTVIVPVTEWLEHPPTVVTV
jgi:hypothetical protein